MVPAEPGEVLQAYGLRSDLPIRLTFWPWVRKPMPAVAVVLSWPWMLLSSPIGSGILKSTAPAGPESIARLAATKAGTTTKRCNPFCRITPPSLPVLLPDFVTRLAAARAAAPACRRSCAHLAGSRHCVKRCSDTARRFSANRRGRIGLRAAVTPGSACGARQVVRQQPGELRQGRADFTL